MGTGFKPETDDMREAPSLVLIDKLLKAGCKVRAYDSAAMDECRRRIGESIYYAKDMYDAVLDADALMLVTEWKDSVYHPGQLSRKPWRNLWCWTGVISMTRKKWKSKDLPIIASDIKNIKQREL